MGFRENWFSTGQLQNIGVRGLFVVVYFPLDQNFRSQLGCWEVLIEKLKISEHKIESVSWEQLFVCIHTYIHRHAQLIYHFPLILACARQEGP